MILPVAGVTPEPISPPSTKPSYQRGCLHRPSYGKGGSGRHGEAPAPPFLFTRRGLPLHPICEVCTGRTTTTTRSSPV